MEPWNQVNVAFHDWNRSEPLAFAHLGPRILAAETSGQIRSWFFIRKHPCWRIRYLPAAADGTAQIGLESHLQQLTAGGHIAGWTTAVYEPEIHAFGGPEAMSVAHRLFHHDSQALITHLPSHANAGARHRRETSLLLCSLLLRAAQQDWYEQGDVWARVAAHRRPSTATTPDHPHRLSAAVQRLITVDTEAATGADAPLAYLAAWASAYASAGKDLATLGNAGRLHRGLRDILAHHVIFCWNRLGLSYAHQAALAATAKATVFGPDPATTRSS
ncbi:thiopeptide-type bacteriocin biosynthesis protein [Frankia sp. AgB1.9]|uniref:thiopeptide-type bacteriocin biosynthesis protein n=1 Tax=unclassified Frankia TaxID=2632575 RepID=UPI0019335B0F|nr:MULTISPECIES: thiopeptide-type bacteriocin biosynthesis protein [unclassified Frankia]MBL7493722.1 thiopeptide-type bacteriocin biosynthesis protein [Frankia sp. AgW1.1]MBL7552794.1 thiopeptide-type bacteriocin biosynthesis protein [Frankia sp. AgB1.9]MBL7625400.1 thiopeptide-type bacteriocin biosynthesis protein [Frankia sp. AgB1.8]